MNRVILKLSLCITQKSDRVPRLKHTFQAQNRMCFQIHYSGRIDLRYTDKTGRGCNSFLCNR